MDWIIDGITSEETAAIYGLRWMAWYPPELIERVLVKPWVSDGITSDEATAITYLYRMLWYQDEPDEKAVDAAIQILDMPFMHSVEGSDASAVRSLRSLKRADEDAFLSVLAHPKLAGGITDEQAKIVSILGGTYTYRPEAVDFLLRGTGVYVEERVIELPESGNVLLAIIRIREQETSSMDFLEHSVRTIEEYMGEPLPTSYVALYFDDANVRAGGGQGTNYGTHMAMSLDYDIQNGRLWKHTPFVIAHEVAHYYWRGSNQDWLDEGPAELLGSISENQRVGDAVSTTNNPCASATTIGELERIAVRLETWAATVQANWFRCNYYLGEAIFLDLYHTLDEDAFRQGFRNLYLKRLHDDPTDGCEGTDLGICHLSAAFKTDVTEDVAAQVDEIVGRWYGPIP